MNIFWFLVILALLHQGFHWLFSLQVRLFQIPFPHFCWILSFQTSVQGLPQETFPCFYDRDSFSYTWNHCVPFPGMSYFVAILHFFRISLFNVCFPQKTGSSMKACQTTIRCGTWGKIIYFSGKREAIFLRKKETISPGKGTQMGVVLDGERGGMLNFRVLYIPKSLEPSHSVVENSFFSILIFTYKHPGTSLGLH